MIYDVMRPYDKEPLINYNTRFLNRVGVSGGGARALSFFLSQHHQTPWTAKPLMSELDKRSRTWMWTSFKETPPEFQPEWMGYLLYGVETCPTSGRLHFQGYLETGVRIVGRALAAKPDWEDIHLEVRQGTQHDAIVYCSKDGQWVEFGTPFQQGDRSDLALVANEILAGELTPREILIERPMLFHQYGRTLMALEDVAQRAHNRPEWSPPQVSWFYGAAGAGKSRTAREEAAAVAGDLYVHVFNDHGWWDLYRGQPKVLFDDYRGRTTGHFTELLRLLDGYQVDVPRRNREPRPFMATHIWFTTRLHPEDIGWDQDVKEREDFTQLLRRITTLRVFH